MPLGCKLKIAVLIFSYNYAIFKSFKYEVRKENEVINFRATECM